MSSSALWMIVGASIMATYVWRAAGMVIASRLHPDSPLSRWFACVAYAVLAGLIARMIIVPEGALADAPLLHKLVALAVGLVVFFVSKRSTPLATGAAFLVFAVMSLLDV